MRHVRLGIGSVLLCGLGIATSPDSSPASVQARPDNCATCHRAISSERLSAPVLNWVRLAETVS